MTKKATFQIYNYIVGKKVTLLRLAIMWTTVDLPLSDKIILGKIYILPAHSSRKFHVCGDKQVFSM